MKPLFPPDLSIQRAWLVRPEGTWHISTSDIRSSFTSPHPLHQPSGLGVLTGSGTHPARSHLRVFVLTDPSSQSAHSVHHGPTPHATLPSRPLSSPCQEACLGLRGQGEATGRPPVEAAALTTQSG